MALPFCQGPCLGKDTTYQVRGMGIRKISKKHKDANENNKRKIEDSIGKEFQ